MSAMIFWQENALEEKIASIDTRKETKAKVEARRRVNLDQLHATQAVPCRLDLEIKFVNFGKQANVIEEKIVLSNTLRNLQLRLPRTTSVGRARTRGRRRRRVIDHDRPVGGPTPRRGLIASKIKGVNRLPRVQLQYA